MRQFQKRRGKNPQQIAIVRICDVLGGVSNGWAFDPPKILQSHFRKIGIVEEAAQKNHPGPKGFFLRRSFTNSKINEGFFCAAPCNSSDRGKMVDNSHVEGKWLIQGPAQ